MKTLLVTALVAALLAGLTGCRDADNKVVIPSPSPTPQPTATPTPTPASGNSTMSAQLGVDGTGTSITGGQVASFGAAMSFRQETVAVTTTATVAGGLTTFAVQRFNDELWTLELTDAPEVVAGDILVFDNPSLMFGDADSSIYSPRAAGTPYPVSVATRIR